jgi:hypothetical protein
LAAAAAAAVPPTAAAAAVPPTAAAAKMSLSEAGAYTRPLSSSTSAVLVTPPRVPVSNRLGENHAPNGSHKMYLR